MLLLGAAIVMWVVAILPEFVVYVGLVIGWVFLGIAEPAQAVKGFGQHVVDFDPGHPRDFLRAVGIGSCCIASR